MVKERGAYQLSVEVKRALTQRVADEVATGKRSSLYGAESQHVEQALRQYLGLSGQAPGSHKGG